MYILCCLRHAQSQQVNHLVAKEATPLRTALVPAPFGRRNGWTGLWGVQELAINLLKNPPRINRWTKEMNVLSTMTWIPKRSGAPQEHIALPMPGMKRVESMTWWGVDCGLACFLDHWWSLWALKVRYTYFSWGFLVQAIGKGTSGLCRGLFWSCFVLLCFPLCFGMICCVFCVFKFSLTRKFSILSKRYNCPNHNWFLMILDWTFQLPKPIRAPRPRTQCHMVWISKTKSCNHWGFDPLPHLPRRTFSLEASRASSTLVRDSKSNSCSTSQS